MAKSCKTEPHLRLILPRGYYYHKKLLDGLLPLIIGGAIDQLRPCAFLAQGAHR